MTSPHPEWKPGSKISTPFSDMTGVDLAELSQKERYKFLIGAIVPRPIAFVSTISRDGVINVAPFSFFSGVSSSPASVVFSVGTPPDGREKDTLANIKETQEFVVNSANEWMIEPVVHCAGDFSKEINEMKEAGLTAAPSTKVSPPRVAESAMQMECKLSQTVTVGDGGPGSSTLVIGEIIYAHIASECYEKGRVDFSKYRTVGRLGGLSYGLIGETFTLAVPKVGE